MSQPLEQHSADNAIATKGIEVFVGGLPRSADEEKIRKIFYDCGEIVQVRMIMDTKGNSKGFCFVKFATKEAAARALKEKSEALLDGKKIGVLPSSEQDTLYIGNINKAWTDDEFQRSVRQVFPDIESIDLSTIKDTPPDQKPRNRGFAFVKFSSHAAASRALRVGSQPDFRLGNLHPSVQWAEMESEVDPEELAKVKVAFVRNLPTNADEKYLNQLFNPYGKVEKVVLSRKGSSVGFVHFTERSDLDRAVNELNGKTVQGPREGQTCVLQVEVARPMDKSKKRVRDNSENISSTRDNSKILKSNVLHNIQISREPAPVDPYEDAVIALPLAVKERLLRILRLGIATRFDIDVNSLRSLRALPEPIAISVLDQFMISGSASQNKSAYLAAVISKHLVDKVGPDRSLVSMLRVEDKPGNEHRLLNYSHHLSSPVAGSYASHADSSAARSDIYATHHSPLLREYPLSNRTTMPGRADERGSLLTGRADERDSLVSSRSLLATERTRMMDEGSNSRYEETSPPPLHLHPHPSVSYGRVGLRTDERNLSPPQAPSSSTPSHARFGPSLSSDVRAVSGQQAPATRPQMRFDPFTGEPYRFDPFTGEPIIHPGNSQRQF